MTRSRGANNNIYERDNKMQGDQKEEGGTKSKQPAPSPNRQEGECNTHRSHLDNGAAAKTPFAKSVDPLSEYIRPAATKTMQ